MDGLGLLGLYNLPELDPQATAAAIQAYAHALPPFAVGAAKWGSETVISMDRLLAKMGPPGWLPNAYNPQLLAANWTENFLDEKFFNPITTGFDSIQGNIYAYTPFALDVATTVPGTIEIGTASAARIATAGDELFAKLLARLRSEKPPVFQSPAPAVASGSQACKDVGNAEPNLTHLEVLLQKAALLEKQWPRQLQALENSGQPLAALTSNVKSGLKKLSRASDIHHGELSRRFHRIKRRGETPEAKQNNWIDDVTGDVLDGNSNYIGNVFDDF